MSAQAFFWECCVFTLEYPSNRDDRSETTHYGEALKAVVSQPRAWKKAARIAILVVALVFAGAFWLLSEIGAIEPSPTVGIIGVVLFVVIAFPVGLFVGSTAEKGIGRDN